MKCSIDNKCPRAASHLKTKAKKNALMEERFAQIETENRLLLEKMSHIMRVSSFVEQQRSYSLDCACANPRKYISSSSRVPLTVEMTVSNIHIRWVKNVVKGSCNESPKRTSRSFGEFIMLSLHTTTPNGRRTPRETIAFLRIFVNSSHSR